MTNVLFTEEQQYTPTPVGTSQSALVKLVIRWGLAKDEKSAQHVLLGTAIVMVSLMFWVLASNVGIGTSNTKRLTPDQLRAQNGFTGPLPGVNQSQ